MSLNGIKPGAIFLSASATCRKAAWMLLAAACMMTAACGTDGVAPAEANSSPAEMQTPARIVSSGEPEQAPTVQTSELPACAQEYLRLNYQGYAAETVRRDLRGIEAIISDPSGDSRALFFDARCNLISDKARN